MVSIKSVAYSLGLLSFVAAATYTTASYGQTKTEGIKAKGFTSKPMVVGAITGVADKEIAIINVNIAPGASSPHHTHPGDCYGAVLEGTVEFVRGGEVMGIYSEGQAWVNPPGEVHYFRNIGDKPAHLVNSVIYEKGKKRTQRQP